MEREVQGKQGESTSQPPQTVPTDVPIPLMQAAVIPPIIPASTTASSTTDATTAAIATTPESSMSMEEMMKAVKELELQATEVKEASEKLAKLEVSYDKSKVTVAEKTREIKALNDPDLDRNAIDYRDNHKCRDEITINTEMQWK